MPQFLCHACNRAFEGKKIRECTKCKRILCDACRSGKTTCKDSPKGTAGCTGTYKLR